MRRILLCVGSLFFALAAHGQQVLRYDLVSGDHLVFRESVDRSVHSKSAEFESHAEWTNHVLLYADSQHPELLISATQRNRTRADLVRSLTNGKDTIRADRRDFENRLTARGPSFTEAGRYDRTGLPGGPITALREWTSQILFDVRELMPLPVEGVAIGSTWRGTSLLGITTRYAANESLHGHDCMRMEGEDRGKTVALKFWFCASSGLVEKIEFSGKFPVGGDGVSDEKISFELLSRTRGESLSTWSAGNDTRQAWLQMAILDHTIAADPNSLLPMLTADDVHLQRRVLALMLRRKLAASPPEVFSRLVASPDARVKNLAEMLAASSPNANKIFAPGAKYADAIVRSTPAPACAASPKPHFNLPPGDYWMTLDKGPITGWPYILHIPEEYRPDESIPAILYLSGGPGRATDGMSNARNTEETTGYILIYPQARGYWWDPESIDMTRELLRELKTQVAIDPDRLYLTGMSNGGTGAFLYATIWPDQFAASVPLMGAGYGSPSKQSPLGENVSALPMLFIHGDQDKVIPMDSSTDAVDKLKGTDRSAPLSLIILPGKGHELVLDDNGGNALPFFEKHTRNPYPKKLHVRARSLADPRQYWIELLDKSDGTAEVDARIEGSTITIKSKNVRKMRLRLRPELFGGNSEVKIIWNGKPAWQGPVSQDCSSVTATAPDDDVALGYSREVVLDGERN